MMIVGRFVYFLTHPSEYVGMWTLDLTLATVLFSVVTLGVVLRQLSLMKHQDNLMQRQTEILIRQDETNRELMCRRSRLFMYVEPSPPSQVVVLCRNNGNKTAQNFYWHFLVPVTVDGSAVWDSTGNKMLFNSSTRSQNGELYRLYSGFIPDPLYPTRITPIARIMTTNQKVGLWWTTASEDGADPTPDSEMQRMEIHERPTGA